MPQELFGQSPSAALERLAEELRRVHKSLIDSVRRDYERSHGPVESPFALFSLVAHDPAFAWLGPMTRQIVEVEDLLGRKSAPVGSDDLGRARRAVRELLETPGAPFADRYRERVRTDPAVAAQHGCLRAQLGPGARPTSSPP
ncbi:MAG TPA: hypothetical protein VEN81_02720 [Planctomycetota bacterium]|jgi:hypothetical protein|nr:hypothetical protein [Planctomycetota bacterium]